MQIKTKVMIFISLIVTIVFCVALCLPESTIRLEIKNYAIDIRVVLGICEFFVLTSTLYFFLRKTINEQKHLADMAAKYTVRAKVFSKAMNNYTYGSLYYIAFLLPDGTRKNIKVNIEQYNTIGEGEYGILTYKEHQGNIWFVSFRPNSSN